MGSITTHATRETIICDTPTQYGSALRLEQRKVLIVLDPDHLEQGFYPEMSTLMGYSSYAFPSPAP